MGGRPPDKNPYLAPFSRYLHIYAKNYAYSSKFPLWLTLERFLLYIPTQNSRFMGGRPPDKNPYLAPFSRYLHIYAKNYAYSSKFPLWLILERSLGYIPTQNSRFMGGRPPKKNCISHRLSVICIFMLKFMILCILFKMSTSADPRTRSRVYSDSK